MFTDSREGGLQIAVGRQIADNVKQGDHDIEVSCQFEVPDIALLEIDLARSLRAHLLPPLARLGEHIGAPIETGHLVSFPREGASVDSRKLLLKKGYIYRILIHPKPIFEPKPSGFKAQNRDGIMDGASTVG
jgi:hypothetical protein